MKRVYIEPTTNVVKLNLGDDILESQIVGGSVYGKGGNYDDHIPSGGDLPDGTPWGAKKHGDWGYDAWDDDDDDNK